MSQELLIKDLNFKEILKNININLNSCKTIAIMGKNGSGKTTLLKSIFGLLDYKGEVYLNQILLTKKDRKTFGIYLGIDGLSKGTAYLNLSNVLKNLNYDDKSINKKIYDISKKFGIDDLLYKNVNELSYSQKKMVAFVKSIIHEPTILLIDDIFSSLDKFYKDKIILYLNQIKKKNKAIILMVINDSEYLNIADQLIIMKNGKIVENDSVDKLVNNTTLTKNNITIPFIVDLSNKLKAYELINDDIYDMDELVDAIWE